MSPYKTRLKNLQKILLAQNLDGFIVSSRYNLRYLSGIPPIDPASREALLLVSPKNALFYHSPFIKPSNALPRQAMDPSHPATKVIAQFFNPSTSIGFEAQNLTVSELTRFQSYVPQSRFEPTQDLIETLRLKKDTAEIKAIIKACRLTAATMSWVIKLLHNHPSQYTERSLARLIDHHLEDTGADGLAFPTIVASGSHSALPHHQPTSTRLQASGVVLMDFGCTVAGYAADMTRTLFLNTPPPHFKKIESIVLSAYQTALKTLQSSYEVKVLTQPGQKTNSQKPKASSVTAATIDQAARRVITQAGYGKNFIHTTGHGLGLGIHESPSLNSNNQTLLQPGMVITLEPGIYLKGKFGYRHENTILLN